MHQSDAWVIRTHAGRPLGLAGRRLGHSAKVSMCEEGAEQALDLSVAGRAAGSKNIPTSCCSGPGASCGCCGASFFLHNPQALTKGWLECFRSTGLKGRGRRLWHVWRICQDPCLHHASARAALSVREAAGSEVSLEAMSAEVAVASFPPHHPLSPLSHGGGSRPGKNTFLRAAALSLWTCF